MRQSKTSNRAPASRRSAQDGTDEPIDPGADHSPRTELGRLLIDARREFLATEGRFLDRDELEREVAERRGGSSADGEG